MAKKKGLKVIIAGSRSVTDYLLGKKLIEKAIKDNKISVGEVVCGMAPGADLIGKAWGESNGVPVKEMPAAWDDVNTPGATVKTNSYGKQYNSKAGFDRNSAMVEYCDVAIVLWDGESNGSEDTIKKMNKAEKEVYIMSVYGEKTQVDPTIEF